MPNFNRRKASPWRNARPEQPDAPSAGASQSATQGASNGKTPPGAPQPVVPHGALGKLKGTLSRATHALGARRVDFSTAFYQHTKHGHKAGSTRFVQSSKGSGAPTTSVQASAAPASVDSARLVAEIGGQPHHGAASDAVPEALFVGIPLDTVTRPDALRTYVLALFEDPSRYGAHASALARRAYEIASRSRSAPKTEAAAAMRGALLVLALRQAGVRHVATAHSVLARIGELDFDAPRTRISTSDVDREAWLTVRLLGRSTEGFGILDALRASAARPFADEAQRAAFKTLLDSADALEPLPTQSAALSRYDGAPGAVALRAGLAQGPLTAAERGPHRLARRAFDAACARLTGGRDALTPDQKGALFAWQQSFTEDGRNTDLSKVRERLNKFVRKTIPRVGESRWKTLLPRLFRGRDGSPLSALRLGTQGATRKTAKQEQALYRRGLQESLATFERIPAMQSEAVLSHARPRHSLVELAALHVWLERGGFAHERMDEEAIVAVAQRARQMCAELETAKGASPAVLAELRQATARWAAMTPLQLARTKPFKSIAKRAYTPERLALWGKLARVPADSPFWASLDALRSLARPTGPSLQVKSPMRAAAEDVLGDFAGSVGATMERERTDEVREVLKEIVEKLPSSARLRLSDGGSQRVSTSGLNVMTHAHVFPVSPRLTLRAVRTRETVVEFSHGTHGFEMFVGRAKMTQKQAGAGLLVGYDVDLAVSNLRAGLTTNVTLHSKELTEASGVTVRVPHRLKADGSGYDDKATREAFWAVVEHFLDEAGQLHGDGANGAFNRLAELGLDHPDLSIGWTDTRASISKRGVTLDANASAKLFKFGPRSVRDPSTGKAAKFFGVSAGPSIGIGWEKSRQEGATTERSGRHRIEQRYVGSGNLVQGRGGVAPGFSHSLDANGRSSVGLLSLDALVASVGLADNGGTAKLTLSIENDKLNYRACTLEREELSGRRYADTIHGARSQLVRTLIATEQPGKRGGAAVPGTSGTSGTSGALVDATVRAGAAIDEYEATVRHNRQFNHAYKYSLRLLRDPAASIDLLTALGRQSGNDPEVQRWVEARRGGVLADPRSWVPRKLSVRERNGAMSSPGLSIGFAINTRTSATGDHDFATLSVPFAVLESIDEHGL